MNAPLAIGISSVAALLAAEWRGWRAGVWAFKPLASLAFVWAGWERWTGDVYGGLICAGLVLGSIGDVLLIPVDKRCFLSGLAVFLLGHLAYAAAFAAKLVPGVEILYALAAAAAAGVIVLRRLWPSLGSMRLAVCAYVLVISAMVAAAWAWRLQGSPAVIPAGATLFYLSDLAVARNRFVKKEFLNKAWGIPFYYAGQFLLAFSI